MEGYIPRPADGDSFSGDEKGFVERKKKFPKGISRLDNKNPNPYLQVKKFLSANF